MSPQQPAWQQPGYGQYDLSGQMQAMSFQQTPSMGGMPHNQMMPPMRDGYAGSPHFSHPSPAANYTGYNNPPQMYPNSYQVPYQSTYGGNQTYAYGLLPNQTQQGRRQNPYHPLPGSFNRQFFNPNSQAFIPGHGGPQYGRAPQHPHPISPAISHASAVDMNSRPVSRQHPTQPHHFAAAPPQHTPHQPLVQPNPQTLTHPLPQPVFAQSSPQPNHSRPKDGAAPHHNTGSSAPLTSSLAKYTAPSLPAKPPPPISESIRLGHHHLPSGPAGMDLGSAGAGKK